MSGVRALLGKSLVVEFPMHREDNILWIKTYNLCRGLKSIMIAVSTVTDDLGKVCFG